MNDCLSYVLDQIRSILEKVDQGVVEEIVDSIVAARTIFIYGAGRSGVVGKTFAVRLVQMGMDVHFVGDMTTPIVRKGDLTMIISNTGETMSAVQTANISRRLGSKVIGITSDSLSKVSQASNVIVELKPRIDEKKALIAPLGTLFEDSAIIFFDCLVPLIMRRLGETEANMWQRHAIWV